MTNRAQQLIFSFAWRINVPGWTLLPSGAEGTCAQQLLGLRAVGHTDPLFCSSRQFYQLLLSIKEGTGDSLNLFEVGIQLQNTNSRNIWFGGQLMVKFQKD